MELESLFGSMHLPGRVVEILGSTDARGRQKSFLLPDSALLSGYPDEAPFAGHAQFLSAVDRISVDRRSRSLIAERERAAIVEAAQR